MFQWEKAARGSMWTPFGVVFPSGLLNPSDVAKRANFASTGTTPVDSFESGMSPFGAYNMAGNVVEWLRNPYDDGFTTAGGGWNDPIYQFDSYGPHPALYSAETLGFRCAMNADGAAGDQGGIRFTSNVEVPRYAVSPDSEFRASKARYTYEKTPLNATVFAVQEAEQWRREEIRLPSTATAATAPRHSYTFRRMRIRLTRCFLSGGEWWFGLPVTDVVEGHMVRLAPYIRAGRAVFLIVLKGFAGREPVGAYANLEPGSAAHREVLMNWAVDMQRGLDYLETRSDIDTRKIAFWNASTWDYGVLFAAVDARYSSVILIGAVLFPGPQHVPPEVNPLHFAPHIRGPKLMLNWLYDDLRPERTSVEPVFRLLHAPKKRARAT